ncbi:MAG: endolytic transglycosylase MltG [Rhodospirillaceae bacterium]|nr:endolytic transglycosylase MltG [Rhodospirillaceae bacterium]
MRVRTLRRIVVAALCGGILVAACVTLVLGWRSLGAPMDVAADGDRLDVVPGTSLTRISEELSRRGILEAAWALNAYARFSGDAIRVHAGEYLIASGTSPRELLDQLVSGRVYLYDLTIIEGWTFADMVMALGSHEAVDARGFDPQTVMAELGRPGLHPEGQFYPDTYRFPRGTPAVAILRQAHEAMQNLLEEAWDQYRATTVLETRYDALTLASIIEKETALNEERRRISGVFHRRLERGMRLQADPTVIYGLGDDFDGDLRRADLSRDTPYNTYTRSGLPPTPIALPGRQSLSAAVDPAPGSELYFVATGQGDGSHYFSTTLDEHREAVDRYQSGPPIAGTAER